MEHRQEALGNITQFFADPAMQPSIFATLYNILDEFDAYVRDLPPGPDADRLLELVRRLEAVIDRTIGLEDCTAPGDEN